MSIVDGIKQSAAALGISPLDLATAISYETGGTFDPTKRGPTTQWGQHRGLIQFGEPQARQYGVDWSDPVGSQLGAQGAVVKYLQGAGVKPGMGLLDVYSAINAGSVGRYNASDANNGGAPGTVRDKVEQQMGGHRQKAMALLGGDYQPDMSQTTPVGGNQMQGILGMVAPQQQEDTRTFTQKLADGARDGSLWDALAMGFNTMRGDEADAGLAASVQGRMDQRADGKRRNQTAEWLRQNGHDDLAAALDQGVVDGSSAMSMIMQRQQQQQEQNTTIDWLAANGRSDLVEAVRAGVLPVDQAFAQATAKADPWGGVKEVNGQLVSMGEGGPQVIGDYRTPDEPGAPTTKNVTLPDGSEVMVQWNPTSQVWDAAPIPQGGTTGTGTPAVKLTESEGRNTGFLIRSQESNAILDQMEAQGTSLSDRLASGVPVLGNYMVSDDYQKFDQAKRDFVNAILRRESGAVISPEEFDNADKQYFPQPGDGPEVTAQKRRNRAAAISGLRVGSGQGAQLPEVSPRQEAPVRRRFNPQTGGFE
ncbi:hypothetical protein [Paracoccus sulfuroxidans]|uniref:Uncharacterized protein n=1 Tax=Paracoccus sulfuroxidans TaxID=384678 RepID=A0A562NKK4_9RHOB|nr:hypothetical protein [Paracoccus sulfuroxidans]TWI32742.1 hypothetical protein IQ24_02617 [Paracoccus sulfuroxidans]